MSAERWKRGHQQRSRAINRAIDELAAMGPEDEFWALLASTDPAEFLRAVAAHIRVLRGATSNTTRDVPGPPSYDPQPETLP